MVLNVIIPILYVQIALLKREIISLLLVVALYFYVLRFTIAPSTKRGDWPLDEGEPTCEPLKPYYSCKHQVYRGQIFPEIDRINEPRFDYNYDQPEEEVVITNPAQMELWTSCCIKEKPEFVPDEFPYTDRQSDCVFKETKTKKIIVYPETTRIRIMFDNAKKRWPYGIFRSLGYAEELRDELYKASNIVIIVNEFSEDNLVYTIRNNVFSKNYQQDGRGSEKVVDGNLQHMPDTPNQSSGEFLTIQTAVNEAFIHYLQLRSVDWSFCIYSNTYNQNKVISAEKTDRLNSWLYISVSVLLIKFISDLMNNCYVVKMLKFHNINPTFVYLIRVCQYIIVYILVSIPFIISGSFGYMKLFPCLDIKITALALFTFYVSSVLFVTLAASFFSRKSRGVCVILAIWAVMHFMSKWIIDFAPNNANLLFMSVLPAGGLYAMLNTILAFEVVDHRESILFDSPRTPTNLLPLGLILCMMWFGIMCNLMLLFVIQYYRSTRPNVFQNTYRFFGHIKNILGNVVNLCRSQRLQASSQIFKSSSGMKTEKIKNMISRCTEVNPKKDIEEGAHFLNFIPEESIALENYSVIQNTITVILGGRISGKSDLLSTFAKNPFHGRISILGETVPVEEKTENSVGFYTHRCPLVENLTTNDHLFFSALQKGFSRKSAVDMCASIVKDMKLTDELRTRINNLGPLEEFKVALSVALMGNPNVLVLDELTSKLHHSDRAEAWKLLLELRRKCTILLSTTSPEEADSIGDYVGIIDHSRLISFGSIPNLRRLYNERYTIRFIPVTSRVREATEKLSKLSQNVCQKDKKIVVSCQEDDDTAKILEIVEDYVDPVERRIETFHPRMLNIYVKAIGFKILESTGIVTSCFKEEEDQLKFKINSKWWTKIRAHYIRIMKHNQSSLKLLLVICAIFCLMFYSRMDECFNRNKELQKIPIQMNYFGVPHTNVTLSTQITINKVEYFKILSNGFYFPPLAIDQIYNGFLSKYGSSRITTYHHPFVAFPSMCWDVVDYDNAGFLLYTTKSSESCMFSFMKMAKYLFFSCSLILTVVYQSERTKDVLEILYSSGSNPYIYWVAAFLAGSTAITAITVIILIQVTLIIPSNELLSDFDIYWNLFLLFMYGLSFINYNNFIALFINKKSNLIVACVFFACIPLSHAFIAILFFPHVLILLPLIFVSRNNLERFVESLQFHFYNPLLAPLPPTLVSKYYCGICKDEWLSPNAQRLQNLDPNKLFISIISLIQPLFYFLMIIIKDRKCLRRCFMGLYRLCRKCCCFNAQEQLKVDAEWKLFGEVTSRKPAYALVIDCPVGKQLPYGLWSTRTIRMTRGTCLGVLRRGDSNISNFMKAVMKTPSSTFKKYLFDNSLSNAMGYCPRKCELHDEMSARQQLSFFARFRGVPGSKVDNLVNLWLKTMGLDDIADLRSRKYDVSSRKKLGVALALIGSPFLAVLEDPTSGVDVRSRQTILSVIKQCSEVKKQSIIIVTEDYNDCEYTCNKVVIIHENCIEFNDDLTTLKYSLCQEPVLKMKLSPSSSKNDIEDVIKSLSQAFPDVKVISERGVWLNFMFPPSRGNLSSINCEVNKLKVNNPILREIFVISSSVDYVLKRLSIKTKKTAYTIIRNWITEVKVSLDLRLTPEVINKAKLIISILIFITTLFCIIVVLYLLIHYIHI